MNDSKISLQKSPTPTNKIRESESNAIYTEEMNTCDYVPVLPLE